MQNQATISHIYNGAIRIRYNADSISSDDRATLEYTAIAYGFLLPRNTSASFDFFADLIRKHYQPSPRLNACLAVLKKAA